MPTASPAVPTGSLATAGGIARAEIVERVSALSGIIRRVDRIDSKRVLTGQLPEEGYARGSPDREVWVVAIAGEVRPQLARGETFRWGVFFEDARTGEGLGTLAGGDEWPTFFDALQDRASRPAFDIVAPCGLVAGPDVDGPQSIWSVHCGEDLNRDARGTMGRMLESQGWSACASGLGRANWVREGQIIGVSEGSGTPPNYIRISQRRGTPEQC